MAFSSDSNGFFISTLNFAWGNTLDGRVESITTPRWLFRLAGTEFEEEAKALSLKLARASEFDCLEVEEEEVWAAISELGERLRKKGGNHNLASSFVRG